LSKENMSPGAMLAAMLSGDKSVMKDDFHKATVDYFAANGCHCTMGEDAPTEKEESAGTSNNTGSTQAGVPASARA